MIIFLMLSLNLWTWWCRW